MATIDGIFKTLQKDNEERKQSLARKWEEIVATYDRLEEGKATREDLKRLHMLTGVDVKALQKINGERRQYYHGK